MLPSLSLKQWIRVALIGSLLVLSFVTKRRMEPGLAQNRPPGPALNLPQAQLHGVSLKRFSLGFDPVIADLLWIRLLQNADHLPLPDQRVSWEYTQLHAISLLQPRFPELYPFGASYLSVFRRDNLGAKAFLSRWNQVEPENWKAPYTLAYHLYYEMGEYEEAARWMLKASNDPKSPPWLSSLGIRLLSETAGHLQTLRMAVELIPAVTAPEGKRRLQFRIRSLRFNLQKQLWMDALAEYQRTGSTPNTLADLSPLVQQKAQVLAQRFPASQIPSDFASLFTEQFAFQYDREQGKIVAPQHQELEAVGIRRSTVFPKHK